MQKVVVIGCPGSGKTFFSRKLSDKSKLPLIHLDTIYHDLTHNYYEDKDSWRLRMNEVVKAPRWIIEGNYKSTFDIRFKAADTIILLDYPRRVYFKRVLMRRIEYSNKRRAEMPESWNEKIELDFIKFILRYKKIERPKVLKLLKKYESDKNVIILHNDKEAKVFIENTVIE